MANYDDLLKLIPVQDIAARLGVDQATAESAVQASIPAIVGGMQANAQDADGERSLAEALSQHQDSSLIDGGVAIDDVDEAEGEKIVGHVFGPQAPEVASALAGATPAASVQPGLIQKVLPLIAPIVLAYLAKRVLGGGGQSAAAQQAPAQGGDLGDLLGGLLSGGQQGQQGQGGLADVLGGLLGGAQQQQAGGGDLLGGILGGLLGGGRR